MKILAINGSHRPGKGTAGLLQEALDEAASRGAEVELVELSQLDIGYCVGCNACLARQACTLEDDMNELVEKMLAADGIILGSPVYCASVTGRMKTFIDRTRPLHMVSNALKGKVGAAIATAGLPDCGIEDTMCYLDRVFAVHEMIAVHPRPAGPVLANGPKATQFAGYDAETSRIRWRRTQDDEIGTLFAKQLGADMVDLLQRLSA